MRPRRTHFHGATESLHGGAGFATLASPKFAQQGLAQSLARELGPAGVYVAHVVIDGQICRNVDTGDEGDDDRFLAADEIARNFRVAPAATLSVDA